MNDRAFTLLAQEIAPSRRSFLIGAAAAGSFFYGRSTMPDTLVPARSVREINEDIRTVKEQLT